MQRIEDSPSERGRAPPPSEAKWLLKQIAFALILVVTGFGLVTGMMLGPCYPTC